MFSFHKPKIYRSNAGCCICKAKSSSSRFTDSAKYEAEFERCFRIKEQRSGEICNACVLLVKRWKKLSAESRALKHWHHVVDARAGPANKLPGGARGQHARVYAPHSAAKQMQAAAARAKQAKQKAAAPASMDDTNTKSAPISSKSQPEMSPTPSSSSSSSPSTSQTTPQKRQRPLASIQSSAQVGTGSGQRQVRSVYGSLSYSSADDSSPYKRNYMTTATPSSSSSSSSSSRHLYSKPNSALSSAVFEDVLWRYRQRQQQQDLRAAKRRQQTRAQRNLNDEPKQQTASQATTESIKHRSESNQSTPARTTTSKKHKRSSDGLSSMSVDGFKVSSVLDCSMWRKEKVCCGIIFRGLNNEVAIFPKLYRPSLCPVHSGVKKENCDSSLTIDDSPSDVDSGSVMDDNKSTTASNSGSELCQVTSAIDDTLTTPPGTTNARSEELDDELDEEMRKPRAQKSGSMSSSSDSSISGTGSMETFESMDLSYWNH